MPVMTPDDLHRFLAAHFPQAPPGIVVETIEDTVLRIRQKTHDGHLRPGGTLSGPTMMAMVDCGFYLLLLGRLGPEAVAMAVTTNLNINFMRKAEAGPVLGHCRILKLGKSLMVYDIDIVAGAMGHTVAQATGTYSIPPKR